MSRKDFRLIIVTENASMMFGGEAARPLFYFKYLTEAGADVRLVVHERCRKGLEEFIPDLMDRVHFVPDSTLQIMCFKVGQMMPRRMREVLVGPMIHFFTLLKQRKLVRKLVAEHDIEIVHEPIPISPKQPSLMYGVGAPVVIGPLNGAMDLPPAFTDRQSRLTNLSVALTRMVSKPLNWWFPGKRCAAAVLVSNERTRRALPAGCESKSIKLVANAVEISTWQAPDRSNRSGPITFVTTGRLVSFKALDHLLEAFKPVTEQTGANLIIVGEGHLRSDLETQAKDLGIAEHVEFTGWLKPEQAVERMSEADVFVFPSLQDCGGAVIMEAMCLGLPCISSDWGGGPDYMGEGTGLLVPVDSRDALVHGFTEAMLKIAGDTDLRQQLSRTALEASKQFDWTKRVELLMGVYDKCLNPDQAA